MTRQNLFSGPWDGEMDEHGTRQRVFWRPDDARMGATLYRLGPSTPESRMHMHYGAEEMFFVLSGRPVLRNQHGREELAPGEVVFCPEGRAGMHTFSNPTDEPARDPGDQCRELPRRGRLSGRRIRVGGHSRSRSRAAGEGRRSRHHRPVRDPDRVDPSDRGMPRPWFRPSASLQLEPDRLHDQTARHQDESLPWRRSVHPAATVEAPTRDDQRADDGHH